MRDTTNGAYPLPGGWLVEWYVCGLRVGPVPPAALVGWTLRDPTGQVRVSDVCRASSLPGVVSYCAEGVRC